MLHSKEIVPADALVAEARHRMLNCMQMVVGLLRFQHRHSAGDEARERLATMIEAVGTISRLQRNLAEVGVRGGLHEHLDDAMRLWCRIGCDRGIEVRHEFDPSIDVADVSVTSLALIVQELVTNCFEHAFPDDRSGAIVVSLVRDGAGHATLTVEDDGIGYDPGSDHASGSHELRTDPALGLTLVETLARSAGIDFAFHAPRAAGTIARLRFARAA